MRVDRRTTIKWVVAASAVPLLKSAAWRASGVASSATRVGGYGTDPDLQRIYSSGDLWPLTLTAAQRQTAAALCDAIIPADAHSPSAASVGVVDFIDEWISAPYPRHTEQRRLVLEGIEWLDAEAGRRFSRTFAALDVSDQGAICDDICHVPTAQPRFADAADFFARYRDLTAAGFYTTPEGVKDLRYLGNVVLATFDGPPLAVLKAAGLA
jgi:hypothetical protein